MISMSDTSDCRLLHPQCYTGCAIKRWTQLHQSINLWPVLIVPGGERCNMSLIIILDEGLDEKNIWLTDNLSHMKHNFVIIVCYSK